MRAIRERRVVEETAKLAGVSMVDEQNLKSALRRGWYCGREEFRDWLLEKASERLESHSRKRKNYHGPEVREHGEAKARGVD